MTAESGTRPVSRLDTSAIRVSVSWYASIYANIVCSYGAQLANTVRSDDMNYGVDVVVRVKGMLYIIGIAISEASLTATTVIPNLP